MNRALLLVYQLLAGACDTVTGALLLVAPAFTLRLMRVQSPPDALIYISFVGAFVFAVGLAYLFGAYLITSRGCERRFEAVWIITAIIRASVAVFVISEILSGSLEVGWLTVAVTDGTLVLIQAVGLRLGWAANVAR